LIFFYNLQGWSPQDTTFCFSKEKSGQSFNSARNIKN